jgi:hypothetical protein
MIHLSRTLAAWNALDFEVVFKDEVSQLEPDSLPLQAGLSRSSYVADDPLRLMLLDRSTNTDINTVKAGVFYSGIDAGSCCADDPSTICRQTEYCELLFMINRQTAETKILLAPS